MVLIDIQHNVTHSCGRVSNVASELFSVSHPVAHLTHFSWSLTASIRSVLTDHVDELSCDKLKTTLTVWFGGVDGLPTEQ